MSQPISVQDIIKLNTELLNLIPSNKQIINRRLQLKYLVISRIFCTFASSNKEGENAAIRGKTISHVH